MDEATIHGWMVVAEFALAAITFVALRFVVAPYGRHTRPGWGPTVPSRVGWIVMESPAVLGFLWVWSRGDHVDELVPRVLLGMWMLHYVHRTFIFPFRMELRGKRMPLAVVALAIVFNTLNFYVNARWISHLGRYDDAWLWSIPMLVGVALFGTGMILNIWSDSALARMRRDAGGGYVLPRGGPFEWVVQPNYLGELMEWLGWAIATWSWAGLSFAVYTFANLGPRAQTNRAWYMERFSDFPRRRKAVIPGIW